MSSLRYRLKSITRKDKSDVDLGRDKDILNHSRLDIITLMLVIDQEMFDV